MATFNEQVVRHWDEWLAEIGAKSGDPDDFVAWAMERGVLHPSPQDVRTLVRGKVTRALRQVERMDDKGRRYRGKQCVIEFEDGKSVSHWFDTDTGGTPRLRTKAVKQRRDAVAADVYRGKRDCDHMNEVHGEANLFVTDFTDDCFEKEAAELAEQDRDDDAA